MDEILILSPALDEKFMDQTIGSALSMSSGDYAIKFAILEQSTTGKFSNIKNSTNILIKKVHTPTPIGIGKARSMLLEMVGKEKYFLSIDSHTLFIKNWDRELVNRYKTVVQELGSDTIISQSLHWALIDNNRLIIDPVTSKMPPWKLKIDGLVAKAQDFTGSNEYEVHHSLSCHFMFGYTKNILDVPFDEEIFFIAEEPLLALRYITRGYKIVAINLNPMYHLSKYTVRPEDDWKVHFSTERTVADARLILDVITGNYIGPRGAPDKKTLEEYKNVSGLSLDILIDRLGAKDDEDLYQIVTSVMENSFSDNNVWTALYDMVYNLACKDTII
jgi:hypothetical protein